MRRHGATGSVITTANPTSDAHSERRIQRLRLTLHPEESSTTSIEPRNSNPHKEEKVVNGAWKGRNGLIKRERPAGQESPQLEDKEGTGDFETQMTVHVEAVLGAKTAQLADISHRTETKVMLARRERHQHEGLTLMGREYSITHPGAETNGVRDEPLQRGPVVYGVVQRTSSDRQQELMAREWSVNHIRDEMRYIREVRDSLEKVRERMYGQFGGMQQSIQKLTQDLKAANSHRRTLENEVRVRTSAQDSFDQMNSSLITANIDLQKSLIDSCRNRIGTRDELRNLRVSFEKAEQRLREREKQLEAVQAENHTLKLQMESSQEAKAQALRELGATLRRQYEEQLEEQQRKHREEIERLQAQLDEYLRRLEEAERSVKIAEAKIAERDQRISEVERLLDCMAQEKSHLMQKLQECEQRLRGLDEVDHANKTVSKESERLQEEAADLKERIKHLNDMVFCQQRKVKSMIEEVQTLRTKLAQKDMFISELLDRIAIVECENNELEDKLKYFMSVQNATETKVQTRDIGVGCDLPARRFIQTLPDKGEKISDSVERIKRALAAREAEERKEADLSSIRTEFQMKYQQALTQRQPDQQASPNRVDILSTSLKERRGGGSALEDDNVAVVVVVVEKTSLAPTNAAELQPDRAEAMEASSGTDTAASVGAGAKKNELAEALERVTLTEQSTRGTQETKDTLKNTTPVNPFLGKHQQKMPHYMEVLEKAQLTGGARKPKFKPNQLPSKTGSPSPSQSPGSPTPLSAEARRQRDKKHLDDITAAKHPPLHHSPAQLLSLEESALLLKEQTRKYQELQAKLAAQKLAEGLTVSMGTYQPEGGPLAAYREVRDDGAQLSSDED
ncbi:protein GRINL1A [Chanos chanos]|uniref:Protein GRINL1A n=1 Tax=Chanos chanos TaxID=29144 RepID=A0A6J2X1T4_CHACN|nr:early endosome antigen 1-like [Chanos chanos]